MPDGANAYPAYNIFLIVGRIRCLHRHPAISSLIFNFPSVNRFSVGRLP
ncbi:hypothetical protein CIT292_08342 [Citrobacter youngae ATCC 29220]|uniref:Uncharacterized protein n=1 Tax=Citrobacter youngae ATCC 29220 TaxID=500640 RepID=D4BCX6_9ENTR|nr:hypothetical protein CIT292_08342 [Citrobacter youngae ATCC 29220]